MKQRVLPGIILIAYSAILIKVLVFKDVPPIRVGHLMLNFGGTNAGHHANFLPLTTIAPYLFGYKGWIIAGINLGGTGQIVAMGNHTITIKRQDGVIQTINLTERREIRTSAGPASESDLKVGDHVTLVVYASETASTVLVCSV